MGQQNPAPIDPILGMNPMQAQMGMNPMQAQQMGMNPMMMQMYFFLYKKIGEWV